MLLTFGLLLTTEVWAWACTGHMLVAEIALRDLQDCNPPASAWAQGVVAALGGALSHYTSDTFVEGACWPDDIKRLGLPLMNDWHYIDMPYNPDGMLNLIQSSNGNILDAITQFVQTLTATNRDEAPLETSIAMRYLIHLIGDLHQPLHAAALYNSQFPTGDWGGTFFLVDYDSRINQLHAFWDTCLGRYEVQPERPLNETGWAFLQKEATALMTLYPKFRFSAELQDSNPSHWAVDSHHLAVTYAYNTTFGGRPSEDYMHIGWQVIQKQLALAGYRVSAIIQAAFMM